MFHEYNFQKERKKLYDSITLSKLHDLVICISKSYNWCDYLNNSNRREHEKTHSKFLYINVLEKEKKFAGCIVCDKSGVSVWISIGNHQLKLNSNIPCTVTEGWKKKTSRVLKKCATYTHSIHIEKRNKREDEKTPGAASQRRFERGIHTYTYTVRQRLVMWNSVEFPYTTRQSV